MSAARPERARMSVVERGIDAVARLDDAEKLDAREDAVIARIHQAVHTLEQLDAQEDVARNALREDLRVLTGYVDRLTPEQLPLIDTPAVAS